MRTVLGSPTVHRVYKGAQAAIAATGLTPREALNVMQWLRDHAGELADALAVYDDVWPGGTAARDAVTGAARREAADDGSLSAATVNRILKWGFGRAPSGLDEAAVRDATRTAFSLRENGDQAAAVKALAKLPGVGPSGATKILALSNPAESAIYDSQAAFALRDLRDSDGAPLIRVPPGRVRRGSGTVDQLAEGYTKYLGVLRLITALARFHPRLRGLRSLESVEKALFVLGKTAPSPAD